MTGGPWGCGGLGGTWSGPWDWGDRGSGGTGRPWGLGFPGGGVGVPGLVVLDGLGSLGLGTWGSPWGEWGLEGLGDTLVLEGTRRGWVSNPLTKTECPLLPPVNVDTMPEYVLEMHSSVQLLNARISRHKSAKTCMVITVFHIRAAILDVVLNFLNYSMVTRCHPPDSKS